MEFTAAEIFQHSPFGDILNSLKSLSLSGEPRPNYGLRGWDSDDEEIQSPPTTHLIATVDDLTDMLDFGSEDFDGMDDEGGDEQEPAPVGSSYDIYMVDAPKDADGDGTAEDDNSKKPPKRRRQRRRSKSCHSRNGDSGTRDNTTPDSAEEHQNQQDSAQEDGKAIPQERAAEQEVEDDNYMPP